MDQPKVGLCWRPPVRETSGAPHTLLGFIFSKLWTLPLPGSPDTFGFLPLAQPCSFCLLYLLLHPLEFYLLKSYITFKTQPKGSFFLQQKRFAQPTPWNTICVSVPPALSTAQSGLLPLPVSLLK